MAYILKDNKRTNRNTFKINDDVDDRTKFITQKKIDILNHKAHKTVWIGAKDSGKTRPVLLDIISKMEVDKNASCMALRKYKTSAGDKLHNTINNLVLEAGFNNISLPLYEKSISQTYRMLNYKNKRANQSIEYASFDDINGIAGTEAPNLSYFAIIAIDEPVLFNDPEKVPTRIEWKDSLAVLKDTIKRSNRRFKNLNKLDKLPQNKWHLMMNAWDKFHPEVEDANLNIPEDKFIKWVVGFNNIFKKSIKWINNNWDKIYDNLKNNHTYLEYNEHTDTLYVRLTKFANPEITNDEETELEAKKAILEKDNSLLARVLGLTYDGQTDYTKTYDLRSIIKENNLLKKTINDGWDIIGSSIGWDIDINVEIIGTISYLCQKTVFKNLAYKQKYKVIVLAQTIHIAYGAGAIGRNNITYNNLITDTTIKFTKETLKHKYYNKLGQYLYIDDDERHRLYTIHENIKHIYKGALGIAKKHNKTNGNSWGIIKRIEVLRNGIELKTIEFEDNNTRLFDDLSQSIKKKDGTSRDESGYKHKKYNTINSLEYSIYPWKNFINKINV